MSTQSIRLSHMIVGFEAKKTMHTASAAVSLKSADRINPKVGLNHPSTHRYSRGKTFNLRYSDSERLLLADCVEKVAPA